MFHRAKNWVAIGFFLLFATIALAVQPSGIIVVETDFGLKDGAVSAMKGVMYQVDKSLLISDLTHEIPPYNIWDGAYRLFQTYNYWPKGTVFVCVVDPGVGSQRQSIVAESNRGQYFVGPDNGLFTFIENAVGFKAIRTIDETKNRLMGSNASYTFHGRDVYGYTAARLASAKIHFDEVGPLLKTPLVKLVLQKPTIIGKKLHGELVISDPQYGNIWSNIDRSLIKKFGLKKGAIYKVTISFQGQTLFQKKVKFVNTFSEVSKNSDLLYINSLLNLAIGTNEGNFAEKNHIQTGPGWLVEVEK